MGLRCDARAAGVGEEVGVGAVLVSRFEIASLGLLSSPGRLPGLPSIDPTYGRVVS